MLGSSSCSESPKETDREDEMALHTLPYDLLLNISHYLDLPDVHALHLTCKALYDFSTTRPVYRKLANDLLRRCRALPLKGFQRLSDLTTEQLIRSVNKANRYEQAWRIRAPRPITAAPYTGINLHSNYMDVAEDCSSSASTSTSTDSRGNTWYKVVSAPPDEDVDWLSPITSSYTLCATKSGKVVCWDVQTDTCLAEWNPGERWELWKCRVEFEERTVFFTMAKVISGSYDDGRIMEFVLMRLSFSENPLNGNVRTPPVFSHVTDFKTTGVVMNVFLLDPSARLLSAFVWVSNSNTIGLYALLDWDKPEYIFIDTGIECIMSSNWSCILYERNIVIHSEESDAAFQHFYPLPLLEAYTRPLASKISVPTISSRVSPSETLTKKFIFPPVTMESEPTTPEPPATPLTNVTNMDLLTTTADHNGIDEEQDSTSTATMFPLPLPPTLSATWNPAPHTNHNPFPFPPWYPESAHFVRQWWPSLPGIPRVSCTVVLLASHDPETHRTRFVLAQHYFRVPLTHASWMHGSEPGETGRTIEAGTEVHMNGNVEHDPHPELKKAAAAEEPRVETIADGTSDDALMRLWYVSTPFEVVCVLDGNGEEEEDAGMSERPRPLVAVDFGHAVWIEYVENEDDRATRPEGDPEAKWLRFVTFPAFGVGDDEDDEDRPRTGTEGDVRTLEIPQELDLDNVETINIDQSQGAVILSVKEGKIFILCYE